MLLHVTTATTKRAAASPLLCRRTKSTGAFSATSALLLHNPNCSKSRRAKELLENAKKMGVSKPLELLQIREYLDEPLSKQELERLQVALGRPPIEWIRSGEPVFESESLSADSTDDELIAAMERHPILMERPIFVISGGGVVGRPPENVLELIGWGATSFRPDDVE